MAGAFGVFGFVGAACPAIYYRDSKCGVDSMPGGYVENGCAALVVCRLEEIGFDGVCNQRTGAPRHGAYTPGGAFLFRIKGSKGYVPAERSVDISERGYALWCGGCFSEA